MVKKCNYYKNSFCLVCAKFIEIKDRIKIEDTIRKAYKYCFDFDLIEHEFSPNTVCIECKNGMIESLIKKLKFNKFQIPAIWTIPDENHNNCYLCKFKNNELNNQIKLSVQKPIINRKLKSNLNKLDKKLIEKLNSKSLKTKSIINKKTKSRSLLEIYKITQNSIDQTKLDTKSINENYLILDNQIDQIKQSIMDENNSNISNLNNESNQLNEKYNTRSNNKQNKDKLNDKQNEDKLNNKLNDDKTNDTLNCKLNDNFDQLIKGPIIYNQRTLDEFAINLKETSSFNDIKKNRVYYNSNQPIPDFNFRIKIKRIDLDEIAKELNLTINL